MSLPVLLHHGRRGRREGGERGARRREVLVRRGARRAHCRARSSPARRSRTGSRWSWRWAARPTRCSTCSPSPTRRGVPLELDDFEAIRARVPVLCDLKPSGRFVATDLHRAGGVPQVMKMLLEHGAAARRRAHHHRARPSAETLRDVPAEPRADQEVIRPWSRPLYRQGHLAILRGNLAPEGAVAKITGVKSPRITGPARVFESEEACLEAILAGRIRPGDVVVIRYEGPRGGPGMREMLAPTSAHHRRRAGRLGRAHHRRALLGRHLRAGGGPRRAGGGGRRTDRAGARRATRSPSTRTGACSRWTFRARAGAAAVGVARAAPRYTAGVLFKYARQVSSASLGAVTDM